MNLKTTFWSLFGITIGLAVVCYALYDDITAYTYAFIKVQILSTSVKEQFSGIFYLIVSILLIPVLTVISHYLIKFSSPHRVSGFAWSLFISGVMGYILRLEYVESQIKHLPQFVNAKNAIPIDALQLERYFLLGVIVGSVIGSLLRYWKQQKEISNSRNKG